MSFFGEFSVIHLFAAQLLIIPLVVIIGMKMALNSKTRRIKRLQESFDVLAKKVSQGNERRKKKPHLDLEQELLKSEERYDLGNEDAPVPLDKLKVAEYPCSVAIPLRLAYLRAEKIAYALRGTAEYWVAIDKALESVLQQFSQQTSAQESTAAQAEAQVADEALAQVVGTDQPNVGELTSEIEHLNKQLADYDKKQQSFEQIKTDYKRAQAEIDHIQYHKQKVLPELSDILSNNEQRDQAKVLLKQLGKSFKDIDGFFPHVNIPVEDDAVEVADTSVVDSSAAQVEILNNIIRQQAAEIKKLEKGAEQQTEGVEHQDTKGALQAEIEKLEYKLEQKIEQIAELEAGAHDQALITSEHQDVQAKVQTLEQQIREFEQSVVQLEMELDESKAHEAELASKLELNQHQGSEVGEGYTMERIQQDEGDEPEGIDNEAALKLDLYREKALLQQQLFQAEILHLKTEQEFLGLFEDYQTLRNIINE